MDAVKKIDVNGREYTVRMFSPIRAHGFYHDLMAVQEKGESIAEFDRIAIGQCLDPMMRPLDETGNFETCFSEHPEDMIILGVKARNELIVPFLPKKPDTKPTRKL